MSVYIKGMEMPTEGNETIIRIQPGGIVLDQYGHHLAITAIPVPEHGRMIDADAFSEKILEIVERQKYDDFYTKNISVGAILRAVVNDLKGAGPDGFSNAPTIIPGGDKD